MRIAYITQSYPPMVSGASFAVGHLAKGMAARGHRVLVITASERDKSYITLENNLTVLRLHSIHNPLRVGQRFLLYPRRAILRSLIKFRPDIIHTHEPLQMGWGCSVLSTHAARIPRSYCPSTSCPGL